MKRVKQFLCGLIMHYWSVGWLEEDQAWHKFCIRCNKIGNQIEIPWL